MKGYRFHPAGGDWGTWGAYLLGGGGGGDIADGEPAAAEVQPLPGWLNATCEETGEGR